MKRKFLVVVVTVLVVLTGIIISQAQPAARTGQLIVTCGENRYELEGELFERCSAGSIKKINLEKTVPQRYDTIATFDVPIHLNKDGSVQFISPLSVTANGSRSGDVLYKVYTYDGTTMLEQSAELELPAEDIDGCIVEVQVRWGNSNNYGGYKYFFAAIYKTDM